MTLRVAFEEPDAIPVERMVVASADAEGIHPGQVVSYRCQECAQADEDCHAGSTDRDKLAPHVATD